jgi:tetratricopeptide (TPR) repeat protein
LLLRATADDGDDDYLYYQLGKTYFVQKKYAAALVSFNNAIELIDWSTIPPGGKHGSVPDTILVDLVCSLAYSYVNTNNLSRALKVLETHIALRHGGNRYADIPHALGYVYLMKGDIEKSTSAYLHSLEFGCDNEHVKGTGSYASYFHLGLLSEFSGKTTLALTYYRKAIDIKPDYPPALNQLSRLSASIITL